MTSTLHGGMYQPPIASPCKHDVADAARYLGVSESTIRRHLRRLGARVARYSMGGMAELREAGRVCYLTIEVRE